MTGVSFVVPVLNGRRWLRDVFAALRAECGDRPHEIIAVDDGSTDGSIPVLRRLARAGTVRLLEGPRRGAAAAINTGLREARYPVVCQVDQDVIVHRGWLAHLLSALSDPEVAAAQGHYVTARGARFWGRVMGRDLEYRYACIRGRNVDHVCTGNTAYRATALFGVGLLDEGLGYGYDNDLSYRLAAAGHRLVFCREAFSTHHWREGVRAYLQQQFGVGYGRLDVLARHPRRAGGDDVSGTMMMLHAPLTIGALGLLVVGLMPGARVLAIAGLVVLALLALERAVAGIRAWRRSGDAVAMAFPITHLLRDLSWAAAIALWLARRSLGRTARPGHSMLRPDGGRAVAPALASSPGPGAVLAILPAFNEAENLPRVVDELRRVVPQVDLLVVNDCSTDATADVLPCLRTNWLTLSSRAGVGGAVRAGIRYALRHGYAYVVRVDADGQHRPRDIHRLLAPVLAGRADAAIGSRFLGRRRSNSGPRRISQGALAMCLTLVIGRRITDPTSGFWLFGPRALRLLARHHPGGYSEPELLLLLSRNRLRTAEVPIRMRPRIAGRTSLTPARALLAFARTALALVVVPMTRVIDGGAGD